MFVNLELGAEIRRRVRTGEIRKRAACNQYELHGATLKKILEHEELPGYRRSRVSRRPTVEPVLPIIRRILEDDTKAPRKQRHTAHRLGQRLRDEYAFTGGYTVVEDAVREMEVGTKEVFLPLSHPPGEARVDFGFARAGIGGVATRVARFVMGPPYSDAVYRQAFPRECTGVFPEGHVRAFAVFGGVPRRGPAVRPVAPAAHSAGDPVPPLAPGS